MSAAAEYAREHRQQYLDQLSELLRIPSVSTDPEKAGDMRRAAQWVRRRHAG